MLLRGALFLALAIWVLGAAALAQRDKPTFLDRACPFFMQKLAGARDADINCGILRTPENRKAQDAAIQLELFVVRISAGKETTNAPIVYLEGGPGGAGSAAFAAWLDSSFQPDYDIILVDQRGSGLSLPSLNCYESIAAADGADAEWIRACRERLTRAGVDLSAYHSASNAHDIHDLLAALEIPQANIYGRSYGTRLGLTLARDFPQRLRSLMIDAVFPPQVAALETQPLFAYRALERLFVDCEQDPSCWRAYPNLRASFYIAIANMNAAPARIEDAELDALIETTGDDFVKQLVASLYDRALLPYLPALIAAFAEGDYEFDPRAEAESLAQDDARYADSMKAVEFDLAALEYLNLGSMEEVYAHFDSLREDARDRLIGEISDAMQYAPYRDYLGLASTEAARAYLDKLDESAKLHLEAEVTGQYDSDSEGLYFSIQCAEEIHFNSAAAVEARLADLPAALRAPLLDDAIFNFAACEFWDVPSRGEREDQPVESDIPTLVFSGAYDPITPPDWGEAAAKYLANSWHFVFPNAGHGALLSGPCADSIALSFLADPTRRPEDACMEDLTSPDFYIRP